MLKQLSRRKRTAFILITLCFSLVLGLLALEIVSRVLRLAPPLVDQYNNNIPDPYLPYKKQPNSVLTGRSETDEFDYVYRHNSFGFRDVEHSLEKAEGVFRILGLGDSFTYGIGVDVEKTYLYRLEELLNSRPGDHPRVEIIKAGFPRFYPEAERLLFEKYAKDYSPDLTLVGFVPNDVHDTCFGIDAVVVDESGCLKSREAAEMGAVGMTMFRNSHLSRVLLKRYVDYKTSRRYQPVWDDIFKANGVHEKDWQTIEREYGKLVSQASEIESRVILVHIPQSGPWDESHEYPPSRLAKWAHANDAGFVDALPSMKKASHGKSLYYAKDQHCTSDGYQVIARAIYSYLTDNLLVP